MLIEYIQHACQVDFERLWTLRTGSDVWVLGQMPTGTPSPSPLQLFHRIFSRFSPHEPFTTLSRNDLWPGKVHFDGCIHNSIGRLTHAVYWNAFYKSNHPAECLRLCALLLQWASSPRGLHGSHRKTFVEYEAVVVSCRSFPNTTFTSH